MPDPSHTHIDLSSERGMKIYRAVWEEILEEVKKDPVIWENFPVLFASKLRKFARRIRG